MPFNNSLTQSGKGEDADGEFTLDGTATKSKISMRKTYKGSNKVMKMDISGSLTSQLTGSFVRSAIGGANTESGAISMKLTSGKMKNKISKAKLSARKSFKSIQPVKSYGTASNYKVSMKGLSIFPKTSGHGSDNYGDFEIVDATNTEVLADTDSSFKFKSKFTVGNRV